VLEEGDDSERAEENLRDMASSYINMCSVYSAMGKHQIALNYGIQASDILQDIIKDYMEIQDRNTI
jgi:hypothetical protein